MFPKNRRKKSNDSMDNHSDDMDASTKKNNNNQQHSVFNLSSNSSSKDLPPLLASVGNDKSASYISHLLQEADLSALIPMDAFTQIKFFLDERSHLINQLEVFRAQYDKQYGLLKRRLEESESENERLTNEHRLSSKELLLYKNLVDAPDSPTKSKDYQQLRSTIDQILEENQCLYAELNHFKTSDPLYEQIQLLESTNQRLKQELTQMKKSINVDEIKHLKTRLNKTVQECEQLRTINKRLIQQRSSPQEIRATSSTSSPLSTHQFSPVSHRSSRSSTNENLPMDSSPTEVMELREHVQRLEKSLHQRDFELQKLQNEIEKGTNSIRSSLEDLFLVSTSTNLHKHQPSINDLQNEIDQLHDKLDELLRENQLLKTRTQEFDTIYEENEYLYAEKSQWNEELERSRLRQLLLEQENHSLKEREKEFLSNTDASNNSNLSQLKLKVEWFNHTNNQLELETVRLREQIDSMNKKYEQSKRELAEKNEHFRKILEAAEQSEKLPQELARIEKLNSQMEIQVETERQEYEKTIAALEEQSEQREKKYITLYDTIVKLQNEYHQKEFDFLHEMNDVIKQRDTFQTQLASFQHVYEQIQEENKSLKEEISSKNEITRDLKVALTSSNQDSQDVYNQLRQLSINLTESQQKYNQHLLERDYQIENLRAEQKQIISKYDAEILKLQQTIIQFQHMNNQYSSQIERYQLDLTKLQTEIDEKQHFIEQIQNDLSERNTLHLSITTQLTQENKAKMMKITELEEAIAQEQQQKNDLQRTIGELKNELTKSRSIAKESIEKSVEFERRFHETDQNFLHLNETTEPTRRELTTLRHEMVSKSDHNTALQHLVDDEKLKRQRLEMKLKRLKDEYINVRKELYNRIEDQNRLEHDLIEYRFKSEYYSQLYNQSFQNQESQSSTAVQLYLKEKADSQHWQVKYTGIQQKFEQLQKNYETIKEKYKQRIHEERDLFERTKMKYLEHIKNVQKDLNETRKILEKDAELKVNQESAYQQLVDERRQLLTSMIDKDAKVREMRRENLLLTSKIQLLENQMENLNERVDQTLRERSLLRRDHNLSVGAKPRSSSKQTVYFNESYAFPHTGGGQNYETTIVSS